jgi:hypothetical protein
VPGADIGHDVAWNCQPHDHFPTTLSWPGQPPRPLPSHRIAQASLRRRALLSAAQVDPAAAGAAAPVQAAPSAAVEAAQPFAAAAVAAVGPAVGEPATYIAPGATAAGGAGTAALAAGTAGVASFTAAGELEGLILSAHAALRGSSSV